MFAENLKKVNEKIAQAAQASGRFANDIKLVAVTKKIPVEHIRVAYNLGIKSFAENYVQEAILKQSALSDLKIDWHFIGRVQTNKIKILATRFSLIHSVDREKIITGLAGQKPTGVPTLQDILLEVNLAGEASKGGCAPVELPHLIECIQKQSNMRLCGLMFMPPLHLEERERQTYYLSARKLRDKMQTVVSPPHSLVALSMGTSHDFEMAIREGATIIRLGTVLFGSRL